MDIEAPTIEIANAARWFAEALQISNLNGSLEIEFIEFIEDSDEPDVTTSGWIEYGDRDAVIYIRETYSNPREEQLEILAHEMVHLKQYLTGDLVDEKGTPYFIWKGERFTVSGNPCTWTYWEAPWEIEAFGRQTGLEYMYKESLK